MKYKWDYFVLFYIFVINGKTNSNVGTYEFRPFNSGKSWFGYMKKWNTYALFSSVILMAFPCAGKARLKTGDGDEKEKKKKKEEEQSNTQWLFPRSRFFNLTYRSYPTLFQNHLNRMMMMPEFYRQD